MGSVKDSSFEKKIQDCIRTINEIGDMMDKITTWDYATYGYRCLLLDKKEVDKIMEESDKSRVLSTVEVKEFFKKRLEDIMRDVTSEKLKRVNISEKEFNKKYKEFENVINFLAKESEKVYEVVRHKYYYNWLIYIKTHILFFTISMQVHLD